MWGGLSDQATVGSAQRMGERHERVRPVNLFVRPFAVQIDKAIPLAPRVDFLFPHLYY